MTFIASGASQTLGTADLEYVDLIEDPSLIASGATAKVVGRVFPQLKVIAMTDDEIVAATSYKSNRNWTLPELSATLAAPSGGTSTGILGVNKTMYLTYSLDNSTTTGLTTTLPCQSYIKISNVSSSAKDVQFKMDAVDLLTYMRKIEAGGYDGLGFHAYGFKVMYQIVDSAADRPDPAAWKVSDFTNTAITTVSGETIDPVALEVQTPLTNGFSLTTLVDTGATTFDIITPLNMASKSTGASELQFGDERFFYGNIETYIGASIYKTFFPLTINPNIFNTTSNESRSKDSSTNPPTIRISEVAIYDSNKNLVIIGKLSKPTLLLDGKTITLELSLDF